MKNLKSKKGIVSREERNLKRETFKIEKKRR